jgi:hypothetical protein
MKRSCSVTVRGETNQWAFDIGECSSEDISAWRDDGLEVDEIYGTCPAWTPAWMVGPWMFMCDVFNFRFKDAAEWITGAKDE